VRVVLVTGVSFPHGPITQTSTEVDVDLDDRECSRAAIFEALEALAFTSATWNEWGAQAQAEAKPGVDPIIMRAGDES
jgi:hypothetical protein